MPILNLNHVSLYYEEFGQGDRYLTSPGAAATDC